MALQDSAMLVSLEIKQWSARKLDKGVSYDVCNDKQADQGSGAFHKQIIPKKYLANINQLVNKIRNYHYANTLAWSHKGVDLLPSRNYMEYTTTMGNYKDEFKIAVNEFLDHYDTVKNQVQNNLNDLYNENDYPEQQEIAKKFIIDFNILPVPESGDFRVDIGNTELAKVKKKLQEQLAIAESEAEKDLFSRLYSELAKAILTLECPDKIFRNSLIFNIETICKKIPKLNINNNNQLNVLAKEILNNCTIINFDSLRNDINYRKNIVTQLKIVLVHTEKIYEQSYPSAEDNKSTE